MGLCECHFSPVYMEKELVLGCEKDACAGVYMLMPRLLPLVLL